MQPVDFIRALGVAILILVLDLCCAFLWVSAWVLIDAPPQPISPMDPVVIELSGLSTRVCGPILFALFVWLFSRRRPDRNAWAFGLSVFGFYFVIDWGIVGFRGTWEPAALMTMLLKLLGALAGAWLARRGHAGG